MNDFKKRWEITKNWQLLFPFLGVTASLLCGYIIAIKITNTLPEVSQITVTALLYVCTLLLAYVFIKISLWCFKKLKHKWQVNYRWEFIAIFLCFAVTGSTAGRLSDPLMNMIGLSQDGTNGWVYWPVRILLIFPIYQVLLVFFGYIFGQYSFFKQFARKMMFRIGLGLLVKK